jgi:hypothetical protein
MRGLSLDEATHGAQWRGHHSGDDLVKHPSPWPGKIMALLRVGNAAAAIAQVKVAPSVKELKALQKAMVDAKLQGKWRDVDLAVEESLAALSAPRLHRAP